jgi:cyanate permease
VSAVDPARPRFRWVMLAGVCFSYFCFGMTVASLAPLVEPITAEFGMTHSAMGFVLGAWQLVFIASAAPCGAILDRIGIPRGLVIAGFMIALSGVLRALSLDFPTLLVAVAVFGLAGPLVSVGAPKLIAQWFEGADRGFAMGLYISVNQLGSVTVLSLTNSVMMPLLGGSWRNVLFANAALMATTALVWIGLGATRRSREAERAFAAGPRRSQREVFGGLVRIPAVRIVLLMSVGVFFVNHALNQWLPEILRAGGMAPDAAGYWASIPTAVAIFGSLMIPRLAVPSRRIPLLAGLMVCLGVATLLIQTGPGALLALALLLQGIARSSLMSISMLVLMDARGVSQKNVGAAGGLFFSAAEIGGVLGPFTLGTTSDLTGGFAAGLYVLSAVCAVLLILLTLLRRETLARARMEAASGS